MWDAALSGVETSVGDRVGMTKGRVGIAYGGRGFALGLVKFRRHQPRTVSPGQLSAVPCGTGSLCRTYPGLRPGLHSVVPAGLNLQWSVSPKLLRGGVFSGFLLKSSQQHGEI